MCNKSLTTALLAIAFASPTLAAPVLIKVPSETGSCPAK